MVQFAVKVVDEDGTESFFGPFLSDVRQAEVIDRIEKEYAQDGMVVEVTPIVLGKWEV